MLKYIKKKWNIIDSIFWGVDQVINKTKHIKAEPRDVERMIAAETKHLKSENESLKKLAFPKKVKKSNCKNNIYTCPNFRCEIRIAAELIEQYKIKYCPECGQRIYMST